MTKKDRLKRIIKLKSTIIIVLQTLSIILSNGEVQQHTIAIIRNLQLIVHHSKEADK